MKTLSVVIPNHNYGRFVGEAVDSALALDWPDVEVVVVDDGSTDDSVEVLRAFGDRITLITQENAGPRVACNRGFAASRGDAVIFLDSDDVLEPTIAREVSRVWRDGLSKVQVQMSRIGPEGALLGSTFPRYDRSPSPEEVRRWLWTTSAYPTPPGSGNVYARAFLDRLMPLDDSCGDATDSACLAAAPLLGDVATLPRPLVRYRVHRHNRSSVAADPTRLTAQIDRAVRRHRFAVEVALGRTVPLDEVVPIVRRGRHLLQMRVAEARLVGGTPPLPRDRRRVMVRDSLFSPWVAGPETLPHRVVVALWCLIVLAAPKLVVRRLVERRFL